MARLRDLLSLAGLRFVIQIASTLNILVINKFFGQAGVTYYSACFAGISLCVIVYANGLPIFLLRKVVEHQENEIGVLRRCQ